ncbi:hypothetical protein NOCD_22280, partial [Nocardioides cavernae]
MCIRDRFENLGISAAPAEDRDYGEHREIQADEVADLLAHASSVAVSYTHLRAHETMPKKKKHSHLISFYITSIVHCYNLS